mmetsp:Transcript_9651/g.25683  ORF Transcript_9651/g.25683 Transcript_9651/m.25683 type:complete len:235 (+) Transcript_9651:147-851(+)
MPPIATEVRFTRESPMPDNKFLTSRRTASELCSRRPTTSAKEGLLRSLLTVLFLNTPPDRALAKTPSRAAKRSASSSSRCVSGKGNAATEFSILHILTSMPRLTSATFSRRASKSAVSPDGGDGSATTTWPRHFLQSATKRSHCDPTSHRTIIGRGPGGKPPTDPTSSSSAHGVRFGRDDLAHGTTCEGMLKSGNSRLQWPKAPTDAKAEGNTRLQEASPEEGTAADGGNTGLQ